MPDPADTGTGETAFFGRQSVYDFTSRIFPDDLGQEDMAHYMIININVPTKTSGGGESKGRLPNGSFLTGAEGLSKVDRLRFGGNGQLNIGGDAEIPNFLIGGPGGFGTLLPEGTTFGDIPGFNVAQDFIAPQRRTTRIKESIALHMPNGGLVYTEENKYEEVSMTAVLTGAISTAVGLIPGAASPFNSEKEVQSVKSIIRTLRYYAAPEITLGGFAFVPPADFDITFFQAGKENTNLPRINTCVLDRIDVDYSPEQSYSTFANGHPVAVRLSLGFREVEILHKERVLQGF
jgi:hypothetical protein